MGHDIPDLMRCLVAIGLTIPRQLQVSEQSSAVAVHPPPSMKHDCTDLDLVFCRMKVYSIDK